MGGAQTRTAIATGTCITLGVAIAVSLGVVPRAVDDSGSARLASLSQPVAHHHQHHHAVISAHVRHAVSHATVAIVPAVAVASDSSSAAVTTAQPVTKKPAPKPAVKKHPKKKVHHKKSAPKPQPSKPQPPKKAPRTKPSQSALSSAIAGLRNYVHTPFTPSASQVAEFGDDVCSAFDKNESYAHVKSVILQKVQQLPFTTVTAGAADYVVKTAVSLFCPAYKSKLS